MPILAPEQREDSYTDLVVAALIAASTGSVNANPQATAALEVAAGQYARAFAVADVTPVTPLSRMLHSQMLASVGRELIRRGESVWFFDVDMGGGFNLHPVATWDITGKSLDRTKWTYRVDVASPSGNYTRLVPGASILHFQYAADPGRPWVGLGPLNYASLTGQLYALVEEKLRQEAQSPVANLIPVPQGGTTGGEKDPLATDIEQAKGDALMVRTTQGGWDQGQAARPQTDWQARRLGPNPPAPLIDLERGIGQAVLASCGLPVELFTTADGTGMREAWRRFLWGSVQPMADIMAYELSIKFESEFSMSFDKLFASDLATRARAFQSLVGGGMEVERAAALAGVLSVGD